jgi:hypothetical protein
MVCGKTEKGSYSMKLGNRNLKLGEGRGLMIDDRKLMVGEAGGSRRKGNGRRDGKRGYMQGGASL